MRDIGVGIIGTGFMGKAHGLAYRAVAGIFPVRLKPVLETVADNNREAGERAGRQLGFKRVTHDWRELVEDPRIEIVSITTPNPVHKEMSLAAIKAGKHVHCEKPIAPNAEDAREMMEAAEKAKIATQVGYNYIKNPLIELARQMIADGELGEITSFRGIHAEDYMGSPDAPHNWRIDPSGGSGVIADLGSHVVGMARFLLGPISEVSADLETVIKERPVAAGAKEKRKVVVDDIARLIVRFARGCGGTMVFTQERLNELLHFRPGENGREGFTRIEAGPPHYPYGLFCVAPGHQLGFNDLKTIEVADFLEAIDGGKSRGPNFREAWEIQKVIDTAVRSGRERRWLKIP
jgi:predicted dehydrogenase